MAKTSPTKQNRLRFTGKVDEIDSLADWVGYFRTAPLQRIQTTSGPLGAKVHSILTPRVEVRDAAFRAGIVMTADNPFPRLGVAIRVSGVVKLFGNALTDSNMFCIAGHNGMIARLEPGSHWCTVSFDWDLIRSIAEAHDYAIPDGDHSCGIPIPAHVELKTLLCRTAAGLRYGDVTDEELEDELARAFLRAMNPGTASRKMQRGSHMHAVHRVIDFIQAEHTNPITVTDICQIASLSERNLEYVFRGATGVTVQQYLMHHRLHRARAMLLKGEYEQVKGVAIACGIPHAGRFSQYYKRLFGQLPRETLAGG